MDIFHHTIVHYPKLKDCEMLAAEMGESFERAAQVSIYWAGVAKETKTHCDLKLSYVADKELEFSSNIDFRNQGAGCLPIAPEPRGSERQLHDQWKLRGCWNQLFSCF